jgi:lipopolysaccharide transport system ATP-binding protein
MSKIAIRVENLSKQYRLGNIGTGTLRSDLQRYWANLRGKEDPTLQIGSENTLQIQEGGIKNQNNYVWALRDINFDVKQGEVLGIIGKNGAGKSTLLKILSEVTAPTIGHVKTKGRIASLLEVGTGFHPELTGRENIFLNGAILGMTKTEIRTKLDEIINFAGVAKYIDTPVKRYSSGMYVRLAFAVAAHLEPEILILDEVLAVGDAEFQKKALGKMKDVSANEGRTILFVSHDLNAIMNLCDRTILLNNGTIVNDGSTHDIIMQYKNYNKNKDTIWKSFVENTKPHFEAISLKIQGEQPYHKLIINFSIVSTKEHKPLFVAFDIANSFNIPIMQAIPTQNPFITYSPTIQNFQCEIDINGLIPDIYFVSAWIGEHYTATTDWQKEILSFEILKSPIEGRIMPHSYNNGFLIPNSRLINYNDSE